MKTGQDIDENCITRCEYTRRKCMALMNEVVIII